MREALVSWDTEPLLIPSGGTRTGEQERRWDTKAPAGQRRG